VLLPLALLVRGTVATTGLAKEPTSGSVARELSMPPSLTTEETSGMEWARPEGREAGRLCFTACTVGVVTSAMAITSKAMATFFRADGEGRKIDILAGLWLFVLGDRCDVVFS
jgi:hypothetical protein